MNKFMKMREQVLDKKYESEISRIKNLFDN